MSYLPDRSEVVIPHLVERHAAERPDATCATFEDGSSWTWSAALEAMHRASAVLADRGVGRGDRVVVLAPNGPGWLRAWLGVNSLGAAMVPVNTAYRGEMLRHVCADSEASLAVAPDDLAERLAAVGAGLDVLAPGALTEGPAGESPRTAPVEPWDVFSVTYTSGTTGPSKGVLTPYLQVAAASRPHIERARLTADDTALLDAPLFHVGGQVPAFAAWQVGAAIAVRTMFSGTRYLEVLRETGATYALLIGTMAPFLAGQPEREDDADTPLRAAMASPMVPDPEAFKRRFGLDSLFTSYGSTETGLVMVTPEPIADPRSCGRPREGVAVRLVDEHDVPVDDGEVGELIVRTDRPWELMVGYHGRAEETALAWRNGWFHTGDAFRVDGDGNYYFVDRFKDALRRRGENISSFEVEREAAAHPDVAEAACVAAPGELGDDEVKVYVLPREGATVDPAALVEFLVPRMAHFMVPRYVEVVDELPKTPTMRVKKYVLRERGNTDATWDREAAGIEVRRHA